MVIAAASTAPGALAVGRTSVLADDRGLRAAVSEFRAAGRAEQASVATVAALRTGVWDAEADAALARGGFGLLILDGVLVRRVGLDGRYGAELLATGDLLRPWEHDGEHAVVPFTTRWNVVAPVRMAVLDLSWAERMGPFPEVAGHLMGRVMERSRRLAVLMAIAQRPRLDERLRLLFWELADRYGVVRPDGIHIDLPLTHEVLGHLVAASRPPVSSRLGRLAREGLVRRAGRGWIVNGEPPAVSRP